ncbi:uncharacterized protein ND-MNLL [Cherax quadricarinatus]|uniref:uncharacterized protein ND-MNLL n=1 Tax=Cherax quadricarinatus TaxID=27406 RepID=UPI0023798199|nr:uncharacterized protein LOC128700068 [Cherax quadricarinatus]
MSNLRSDVSNLELCSVFLISAASCSLNGPRALSSGHSEEVQGGNILPPGDGDRHWSRLVEHLQVEERGRRDPASAIINYLILSCLSTSMTFFAHVKLDPRFFLKLSVPLLGFCFGAYLDRIETERLTMFRDKSALYGRVLAEGEKPSWP